MMSSVNTYRSTPLRRCCSDGTTVNMPIRRREEEAFRKSAEEARKKRMRESSFEDETDTSSVNTPLATTSVLSDISPTSIKKKKLDFSKNRDNSIAAYCRSLPVKTDIHCHFTGSVSPEDLLRIAKEYGLVICKDMKSVYFLEEVAEGQYQYAHPLQEGKTQENIALLAAFESRLPAWKEFLQSQGREESEVEKSLEELYEEFVTFVYDHGILWDTVNLCFVRSESVLDRHVLFSRLSTEEETLFISNCCIKEKNKNNYLHFHDQVFIPVEGIFDRMPLSVMLSPFVEMLVADSVLLSTPSKGMEVLYNGKRLSKIFQSSRKGLISAFGLRIAENEERVLSVVNCLLEKEIDIEGVQISLRNLVEESVNHWKAYILEGLEGSSDNRPKYLSQLINLSEWQQIVQNHLQAENQDIFFPSLSGKTAVFFNVDLSREQDLVFFALDLEIARRMIAECPNYVVGIVISGREDHTIAKRDCDLQFRLLQAYITCYHLQVSIHAGEMGEESTGVVELKHAIGKAVDVGAKRIGHGLTFSLLSDEQKQELLRLLQEKKICIESCLSSNELLRFPDLPFSTYLAANVREGSQAGLVIGTDDPGIFRTSSSRELIKASEEYGADKEQLKRMQRDAIRWSFIPGREIYHGDYRLESSFSRCQNRNEALSKEALTILAQSPRALLQVEFERRLAEFENASENAYHLNEKWETDIESNISPSDTDENPFDEL